MVKRNGAHGRSLPRILWRFGFVTRSLWRNQLLGQHLADVPFDRIFSSDLKRAHVTAELIHQANTTQKLSKPLPNWEWDFGRLEGTKIRLLQDIYPQQYGTLKNNLAQFKSNMFDAESVYQATQRIIQFVKGLKDKQGWNSPHRQSRSYSDGFQFGPYWALDLPNYSDEADWIMPLLRF